MARKARDYAAEQRRRNELARERGYTSRGSQRHKIETGKIRAIAPSKVRSPKTKAVQQKYWKTGPKNAFDAYLADLPSDRERALDWSAMAAGTEMAEYRPGNRKEGWTVKRYTDAYMAAWVSDADRYSQVRYSEGGSRALKYWFCEANDFYSSGEYERRYSGKR